MRTTEEEYEDSDSVIYEYEPDYECVSEFSFVWPTLKSCFEDACFGVGWSKLGFTCLMWYPKFVCISVPYTPFFSFFFSFLFLIIILMKKESILSEASYTGYQQNPLMEVLSYCQVFFFSFISEMVFKQFLLNFRKSCIINLTTSDVILSSYLLVNCPHNYSIFKVKLISFIFSELFVSKIFKYWALIQNVKLSYWEELHSNEKDTPSYWMYMLLAKGVPKILLVLVLWVLSFWFLKQ